MPVTAQDWLDAQYSVLGSALISPELVPLVVAETSAADYSGPCQTVYETMAELTASGQAVDVVTLASKLGGEYRQFLKQLMAITPTAANIRQYITLTRQRAKLLQVRNLGAQLAAAEALDEAAEQVSGLNAIYADNQASALRTPKDLLHGFFDRRSTESSYLSWPIPEINRELYVKPGNYVVLGGYPSSGKTAFALQCLWQWSKSKKVLFFSLETDPDTIFDRLMAGAMELSMADIKRGKLTEQQWARIIGSSDAICNRRFGIIPAAGYTVAQIQAVATMQQADIVIVDYLQLIRSRGNSRYDQVTQISMDLHTMAQQSGKIVVALAQLSRGDKKSEPGMQSLRESGQIEQDADVILLLHEPLRDDDGCDRWLRAAKNKEGERFRVPLDFDGAHQTFQKTVDPETKKFLGGLKNARKKTHTTPVIGATAEFEQLPMDEEVPNGW